jgi:cytochrome d ubiquinol oxidase subunit II
MEAVWYLLIALMLVAYVVLDGFDFGAGIMHQFVAKTDGERRQVFGAIGPVWDGNEVWLLAAGGITVYAFPVAYATGFSGFYLPLMMALWLLILRGLSIEFRSKEEAPLWRSFWDGAFSLSSTLMAVLLGAAFGNLIRGVPIDSHGWFTGPLFTNFIPGPHPGVLDWFTVLVGVFSTVTLALHGALYLVWKTDGPVHDRSAAIAGKLVYAVAALMVLVTVAMLFVQPVIKEALLGRPVILALPVIGLGGLVSIVVQLRKKRDLPAFLGSVVYITSLLGATAAAAWPNILISTLNPEYTLTAQKAANEQHTLQIGAIWWSIAIILAIGYFVYLFHSFRGKVSANSDHYGH